MDELIPRDIITKLLLHAEQGIHRQGWDQPPWIGTLHWVRPGILALAETGLEIHNPPGSFIEWLGRTHLERPEVGQSLYEDLGDRFYGFAFVCEAWQRVTDDVEEAESWKGTSFADIPGSIEVRMINAVDIHTRQFMIQRQRGKKPTDWAVDDAIELTGRVTIGLTNMVLGAVRQIPEFKDRLTDLETRFIPTYDESVQAQRERKERETHSTE